MRIAELAAGAVIVTLAAASPVAAAPRVAVSVAAGSLGEAAATLGGQAGVSIGMMGSALGGLRVPGVRGRMTVEQALARLLHGLPARAQRIDAGSWRIVGVTPSAKSAASPRRGRNLDAPAAPPPTTDIVVTASKRETTLNAYSGTAYLLDGSALTKSGARGTDAIIARLPTLAGTALGPGRNKLFIRGIADSSFNGPSQATIGEYLGDVRLNYNAPDPNLTLVDIASVEVLEGPQGTLYGAATLGGVLRIVPNPPVLDRFSASINGGLAATAHGAGSSDASSVVNVPIVGDLIGVRAVAYRSVDGGYIDDPGRSLSNINRTVTRGARATLRVKPGGWTIDLGGAYQGINSADGQYADRDAGPLARRSSVAQPFDNDYGLASLAATRDIDGKTFRASAGMVGQDLKSRFDFTPTGGAPAVFDEANRIRLLSGEISLARRSNDGVGWIVGASALQDSEELTRNLGTLPTPARILGERNDTTNISAFFEVGVRLSGNLVASAGARGDFAHLVGSGLADAGRAVEESRRDETRFLPSLALTWHPGDRSTIFARYQEGFRPGGLSVSGTDGTTVQRFEGDSLKMIEIGTRFTDLAGSGLDGGATLSYAHWENIQADLVDGGGLPFTANVGNGRIIGLEAQIGRAVLPGLRGELAVFVNNSRLTKPATFLMAGAESGLPNVARAGARAALTLDTPLSDTLTLTGDAMVRYVGHSRLGIGPALDVLQGAYFDMSASARIGTRRSGLSLTVSNLLDTRGSRFGLGNPFDVASGRQTVPRRPRTVRIGFDARF